MTSGSPPRTAAAPGGYPPTGRRCSYPRFSRDGTRIAWTSWRDGDPEVYTADTEGNAAGRLTYWGDARTRVTGWTGAGEVLAVSAAGQPESFLTWRMRSRSKAPQRAGCRSARSPTWPWNRRSRRCCTARMNTEPAFLEALPGRHPRPAVDQQRSRPSFTRVLAAWAASWPPRCCPGPAVLPVRPRGRPATSTRPRWTVSGQTGIPTTMACTCVNSPRPGVIV